MGLIEEREFGRFEGERKKALRTSGRIMSYFEPKHLVYMILFTYLPRYGPRFWSFWSAYIPTYPPYLPTYISPSFGGVRKHVY